MSEQLNLNEGQEFYANGQRYVIRDGVPVAEAKRGPLGGELVRFGDLKNGDSFFVEFKKNDFFTAQMSSANDVFCHVSSNHHVETNVPQPQRGRIMTAGEAAKLPDIVGKRVACVVSCVDDYGRPLCLDFEGGESIWISSDIIIKVLD